MPNDLTAKRESLIAMMREDDEYARHGFDLLSKHARPEEFFDSLAQAGFFDPSRNPAPKPAGDPGFVQIPPWDATPYLQAVAKRSGEQNDLALANKVMGVVRSVSQAREPDGSVRDNYVTFYRFAQILALVPIDAVTFDDIDLVPVWLISRFDRSMVGHTLGQTVIGRFLSGPSAADIEKACALLRHCTAFEWLSDDPRGRDARTLIDDYWLKDLIARHAKAFGTKAGPQATRTFEDRLRALFGDERRSFGSSVWRSAIEDSEQNYDFRAPENRFVEGMRDVLLSWLDTEPAAASNYVRDALSDNLEIIRRIAIHCITERTDLLSAVFEGSVGPQLFAVGHRHELYRLLHERFGQFSDATKAAIVDAIRHLTEPSTGEDPARRLKRAQREWLLAIAGQGFEPAEHLLAELSTDTSLGQPSDHPDFLSYHESRWGPGPAPVDEDALITLAQAGTIVNFLNQFKQTDAWKGPTVGGLVEVLQSAVAKSPDTFVPLLQSFLLTKRWYQHALINGLKRAWDDPANSLLVDWDAIWPRLFDLFSALINDPAFWDEKVEPNVEMNPTRDWIAALIADFLQAGTKNDKRAYKPEHLPQGWTIIQILLAHAEPSDAPSADDPMFQALNTPKGRALEALFSHALRSCRLSVKANGSTDQAWAILAPVFDGEMAACRDGNFEFSTLAAAYLANFDYMSHPWLEANVGNIFSANYPRNFECAIGGLAYATPTRPLYPLLVQHGVFGRALQRQASDGRGRERIVEWLSLAYLWGDEEIDSAEYAQIFQTGRIEDLESASQFFWGIRGDKLTDEQIARILRFWQRSVEWSIAQSTAPATFLSSLSRLSCYLATVDDSGAALLFAVAPYVHSQHNADNFVSELLRLVETNAQAVATILERMLAASLPTYDMDDVLKKLLRRLVALGLKAEALKCVEMLRKSLPGMTDLYKELLAR